MNSKWVLGTDDYYYYTEPVEPGSETLPLMTQVKVTADADTVDYIKETGQLEINVYEESYQAKNPDTGNLDPKTDYAKFCDSTDQHCLQLLDELKPKFWFIENPRGAAEHDFYARITTIYAIVLSVRRHKAETYGYMDKSSKSAIQTTLSQR